MRPGAYLKGLTLGLLYPVNGETPVHSGLNRSQGQDIRLMTHQRAGFDGRNVLYAYNRDIVTVATPMIKL